MKVLQVMGCTSNQYASMERYLVRKAERLTAGGGQLTVIYENDPDSRDFSRDFSAAGGRLVQDRMKSSRDIGYARRMLALAREDRIDVVHAYFTPTCHVVALAFKLRGGPPVVRTAANLPFSGDTPPARLARWRYRWLAHLVSRIICRSEGVREAYRALGIPEPKLAVAAGGCDVSKYTFRPDERLARRQAAGLTDAEVVLGVSCRLVPVKRLDRLLTRFGEAVGRWPGLRLWIAGTGPERGRLEKQIEALGLHSCVSFAGHQSDLAGFYSAVDIFCLSSEAEGMSNAILEAMASERPVLASDIPPNRGLVVPGKGGYLVDFESPAAFLDALSPLLSPDIRNSLGRFNRERIVREFSLDARLDQEFEVYTAALRQRGA